MVEVYNTTLSKICKNSNFLWPVFSRVRTESRTLSLYEKIRVRRPRRSSVFIVNFEQISLIVLVFLLLTLNKQISAGYCFELKIKLAH